MSSTESRGHSDEDHHILGHSAFEVVFRQGSTFPVVTSVLF